MVGWKSFQLSDELLAQDMMLTLGNSSAMVAHDLSALRSRVGFVSRVGGDSLGQIAVERLGASRVDVSQVHRTRAESSGTHRHHWHGHPPTSGLKIWSWRILPTHGIPIFLRFKGATEAFRDRKYVAEFFRTRAAE